MGPREGTRFAMRGPPCMPTSLSTAVLQVIVRERVAARVQLDQVTNQLGELRQHLVSGRSHVLRDLPVAVARGLTLLHPGEVSGVVALYEDVLAEPLVTCASRSLEDATITLEALYAAEVIALFELASGRRSPDVVAMGTVDRAARSGFCAVPAIHDRLRMLGFAFGMEATTAIVVCLGGAGAHGSDARILDRLDAALADAPACITAEGIAPTLPFFVTSDGRVRWNDLVWMTSGLAHASRETDVFALIREAIGISVADTAHDSSRVGVRAGFAEPIPTFRRSY
jgi:hypothetical protein